MAAVIDSYSKVMVASAIPDKKSPTICNCFKNNILFRFGAPIEIMCDRGGKFMGAFNCLCEEHKVLIVRGGVYSPTTQGVVERANRTLENAILTYSAGRPEVWEDHLALAVFSVNATRQATTVSRLFTS
jgi:hypothetical protein